MTQDIEQLAQQLEQHPDYRVLRRLVPGRVFNTPAPGQKLSNKKFSGAGRTNSRLFVEHKTSSRE